MQSGQGRAVIDTSLADRHLHEFILTTRDQGHTRSRQRGISRLDCPPAGRMKPVSHSVRRVQPDEGDILAELRLSALLDAPSAFASTHASEVLRTPDDWARLAIRRASGDEEATFIAWDGERPAGLVGAYRSHDDDRVELVSMWTAPASRERGVGHALVQAVVAWASALGVDHVALWVTQGNEQANRLYQRMGFAETGDREPLPSDPCRSELRMILRFPESAAE
jgi:ribosomal protein S18 acetylase RimI-like enzyme